MPAETRGARRARSNPVSESELSAHEPLNEVLSPPPLEARQEDRTLDGSNSDIPLPGHPTGGMTDITNSNLTAVADTSMELDTVPGARNREEKHSRGTDNPSIQDMLQQILLAQRTQNDNLRAVISDHKQEWQEALQTQSNWMTRQLEDLRITIQELAHPTKGELKTTLPSLSTEGKDSGPPSMDSSLGNMSLPITTSSSSSSSSPSPSKRKKRKRRKKKKKKKKKISSSSSSSSSDDGTYFPKKDQSTVLLAIKKSESLQDRTSALHWLIRFRQLGKNMRWTEKQQITLLPLCWQDENDEAKTLWSQTVQNTNLTLLKMEISLLEAFDPDGIYQMQNALATEKQPVNMKCTTWWASILQRWESLKRWSDTADDAYQAYRRHTLKRNFRNKAMINLLDSTSISDLENDQILALCLRADKLTFRTDEVDAEVYRLRGHVRQTTTTLPSKSKTEKKFQARAPNPNRRKLGLFALNDITHKGNIFGRHHEKHDLDGCCWHMSPEGCNRMDNCLLPHISRKSTVCPDVSSTHEDCPRGIHCSFTHPNGKYIGYFESRSTPGKFTKYEWTIPKSN